MPHKGGGDGHSSKQHESEQVHLQGLRHGRKLGENNAKQKSKREKVDFNTHGTCLVSHVVTRAERSTGMLCCDVPPHALCNEPTIIKYLLSCRPGTPPIATYIILRYRLHHVMRSRAQPAYQTGALRFPHTQKVCGIPHTREKICLWYRGVGSRPTSSSIWYKYLKYSPQKLILFDYNMNFQFSIHFIEIVRQCLEER